MADLYREPIDDKTASPSSPPTPALNSVEQEIADLEKQLAAKRASLQEQPQPLEQALGAEQAPVAADAAPVASPIAVSASVPPPPSPTTKEKAEELKGYKKNQQLKSLVDLAFEKGVTYATEVVRQLDSAYLIDEFHDTLVDKLRQELIEKDKLKEI